MSDDKIAQEIPENRLNLKRGNIIVSNHPNVEEQLGVKLGNGIGIGFNGKYICSGQVDWDVSQLVEEIEAGYWIVI